MSNPTMQFSTKGAPPSDSKSYQPPFVESDDASTTLNESALALGGVRGEAFPNDSRSMYHPPAEAAEADIERPLQLESKLIPREQLIMEINAIYTGLEEVETKRIVMEAQEFAAVQEENLTKKRQLENDWQTLIKLSEQFRLTHADFLTSPRPLASRAWIRVAGNRVTKKLRNARCQKPLMNQLIELVGWTMC